MTAVGPAYDGSRIDVEFNPSCTLFSSNPLAPSGCTATSSRVHPCEDERGESNAPNGRLFIRKCSVSASDWSTRNETATCRSLQGINGSGLLTDG